jgi:hypothetical protein
MRKLIVSTFLTLDGVMQAPGGSGEDDSGGFAFGGWSVNYWDELMGQVMDEAMRTPFDLVLGRKTYDIFAAYWPYAPEEAGSTRRHRVGKAFVLGRHHPLRAEARRQQGLHNWSRDRHVRAGRRDRHRIVRAGLAALGITHRAKWMGTSEHRE